MTPRPHPWNLFAWRRLLARRDRLPHALLLAGPEGLGKRDFALALAAALLCEAPGAEGMACGACPGCRRLGAGSHPDLLVLAPEARAGEGGDPLAAHAPRFIEPRKDSRRKPAENILVGQVRLLIEACQGHPHSAERQVAVLIPADLMNINAANSLLKLLEEPPGDTVFLLVTAQPGRLPATVRSRCTRLDFRAPPRQEALAWLKAQDAAVAWDPHLALAGGAPLRARALAREGVAAARQALFQDFLALARGQGDPVASATRWLEAGEGAALDWLQGWLQDVLRLALAAEPPHLADPERREALAGLAGSIAAPSWLHYDQAVSEARGRLAEGVLDARLVMEDLLARLFILGRRK